jgi:LytS/YehU family sensor histidine kinase
MTDPLMRSHSGWSWRLYHDMILQDALYDGMMYGTIVTISQLWESYRKYRERELRASRLEAELAQTELKVLKMQLDPHFLFATLQSVCDLIHRDVEAADDLVASLSELLRISLDAADEQEVTLKREIDYLNSYLEIQQIRFRNRLVVLVKIDPRSLDALVPNMIMPALVENLLRRGFEEVNWAGKVEILSEVRDRKLRIEIRDDLPQSGDGEERLPRSDLGLANAKARLVRLYGSSHDLTLGLNAPGGSYVRLEIPLIMTSGQPADLPSGQPLFEES